MIHANWNPSSYNGFVHNGEKCRACFCTDQENDIDCNKIINDPRYYGSENPEILLLGVAKPKNYEARNGRYEDSAFYGKNARTNLSLILDSLELYSRHEPIDALFEAESAFGTASLLRCPINTDDESAAKYAAMAMRRGDSPASRCFETHLIAIPESIKLIICFSTNRLVSDCIKRFFQSQSITLDSAGDDSFMANGILWIFVPNPSGANNGHIRHWIDNTSETERSCASAKAFLTEVLAKLSAHTRYRLRLEKAINQCSQNNPQRII